MKLPKVSIVIPTYNERENIEALLQRIRQTMQGYSYEVLFVDDSTDGTAALIEAIAARDSNVRCFHRDGERGLATAVVLGFRLARGERFVVMDADLQHPPEFIPVMLEAMDRNGADIVVPSRYVPGGSTHGFSWLRKVMSLGARWLAHLLVPAARATSDPLSGFFAVERRVVEGVELTPIGWKVLLEVLAKGRYTRVYDLPYTFRARNAGLSKLTLRQQWEFLQHLASLRGLGRPRRAEGYLAWKKREGSAKLWRGERCSFERKKWGREEKPARD